MFFSFPLDSAVSHDRFLFNSQPGTNRQEPYYIIFKFCSGNCPKYDKNSTITRSAEQRAILFFTSTVHHYEYD